MAQHELAQMNVARLRAPIDSPQLADFVDALDRINAVADGSPGFVWRLQDDSGNATALRPLGEEVIVNMSVWRDAESLQAFVYRSDHVGVMRRRRDWFEKMDLYLVLWWVPRGHRPRWKRASRASSSCATAAPARTLLPLASYSLRRDQARGPRVRSILPARRPDAGKIASGCRARRAP